MAHFERHLFVCENQRPDGHPRGCCAGRGAAELRAALKEALARHGLKRAMRVNGAGCLDQCEHGPCVVVYPEQVWYGFVQPADVDEIVREHLVGGRAVERLRLPPGCVNTATCPHKGQK